MPEMNSSDVYVFIGVELADPKVKSRKYKTALNVLSHAIVGW